MTARIHTSEPAWRAPVSQSQMERSRGRIQPMEMTPRARDMAKAIGNAVVLGVTIAAGVLVVIMIWRVAASLYRGGFGA